MRIVHVLHRLDFHDGGPPRAVVDLCSVQHRRGHDVTLLTTDACDVPQSWADEGPDVYVVPPPRFLGDWFAPGQLEGALGLLSKADVVHLHAVWERMNAQVATLCRRVGTPYVITLRGMLDDWCMAQRPLKKRIYLSFAGRKYLEGAAFVHCTAEGEREQSARWFPQGTPRVIPNLIDLTPYQELPSTSLAQEAFEPLRGEGPCLLFLSRLHEKKGLEHLIERLGRRGRGEDSLIGRRRIRERDVVANAHREQERVVEGHPDGVAQAGQRRVPHIDAVDLDDTVADVVEARDQSGDGRLAGRGLADQRDRLARRDIQGEPRRTSASPP